jgi:hypothetical protein
MRVALRHHLGKEKDATIMRVALRHHLGKEKDVLDI